MQPNRPIRRGGGAADADFITVGFVAVASAVSFLLVVIAGHDAAAGGPTVTADTAWQVILAFGTMAAGLLFMMHGARVRHARPHAIVRRAVDAAVAVLGHAEGPERLLVLVGILVVCPFLEAWFDFI